MNIQEINQLTKASVGKLTSDAYLAAFNDPQTGKDFAAKINALENAPRAAVAPRPNGRVRADEPAAETPASTSFDPSFDESPTPAPAAAAAPAPAAAAPGNLAVWEYQPKDSQGRPVGGLQRFKYDPSLPNEHPQSLASQLTKAHSCATSALKEKKTREFIESVGPEDTDYVELKRLTTFEHPEAESLNAVIESTLENGVRSALNLFKQSHPEFVLGEANAAAMVQWVAKSKRNPASGATWEAAWTALKPYLLPDEAEATPAPAPVATKTTPTVRSAGVPTGLSNTDVFNEEPVAVVRASVQGVNLVVNGKSTVMDLAGWNRLPSDAQKRILRVTQNAAAIDALYRADEDRKAAARGGNR